jgi:3-hydroxymyristoyl/3-hydroxydecanoyl-(acyl carrier protein) dehydratase
MAHEHNPDLTSVEDVIPHRSPHKWLDGVTVCEPGVLAEGFWTPGPEHYAGHFEGDIQILPGVKQIESAAQLGAYMVMSANPGETIPLFSTLKDVAFSAPVFPGDTLDLSARPLNEEERDKYEIEDNSSNMFWGKGTVKVGSVVTCEMVMSALLAPKRLGLKMIERQRRGPVKFWDNSSQSWVEKSES